MVGRYMARNDETIPYDVNKKQHLSMYKYHTGVPSAPPPLPACPTRILAGSRCSKFSRKMLRLKGGGPKVQRLGCRCIRRALGGGVTWGLSANAFCIRSLSSLPRADPSFLSEVCRMYASKPPALSMHLMARVVTRMLMDSPRTSLR